MVYGDGGQQKCDVLPPVLSHIMAREPALRLKPVYIQHTSYPPAILWRERYLSGRHLKLTKRTGSPREAISSSKYLDKVVGIDGERVNAGKLCLYYAFNVHLLQPQKPKIKLRKR